MIHIDNPAVPKRTEAELRELAAASAARHRRSQRRRRAVSAVIMVSAVAVAVTSLGSPMPSQRARTTGWADHPPAAGSDRASDVGDDAGAPPTARPPEAQADVPGAPGGDSPPTSSAPGAPSRAEVRIAFVDGSTVVIMALDGTGRRSVSTNGSAPVWAPAGRRLAFVEDGELWEYDLAHNARRLLVRLDGQSVSKPSWSPSGTTIVFSAYSEIGSLDGSWDGLWLYETDTGRARRLRHGDQGAIRHDGTVVYKCGEGLCLTDVTGADRGPVPNSSNLYEPTWSPDGRRIAAGVVNGGVAVIGEDGSDRRVVSSQLSGRPAWFPDGTRVAARVTPRTEFGPWLCPCGTDNGIWSMRLDGSDPAPVVRGPSVSNPDIVLG